MAYSANGYNFPDKTLSRVKYDLLNTSIIEEYRLRLDEAPRIDYVPKTDEVPI